MKIVFFSNNVSSLLVLHPCQDPKFRSGKHSDSSEFRELRSEKKSCNRIPSVKRDLNLWKAMTSALSARAFPTAQMTLFLELVCTYWQKFEIIGNSYSDFWKCSAASKCQFLNFWRILHMSCCSDCSQGFYRWGINLKDTGLVLKEGKQSTVYFWKSRNWRWKTE